MRRTTAWRLTRGLSVVALAASGIVGLSGCRPSLYEAAPVVDHRFGPSTKRVRAKREPDRLIADDLTVCWVIAEVFAGIKPGDLWRCDWRPVPSGM